jgi:hypothetical protein
VQAVNEWRKGGGGDQSPTKNVKFAKGQNVLGKGEPGVRTGNDDDIGPKEACWQCFKLKPKTECKELAGKFFCSDHCSNVFKA